MKKLPLDLIPEIPGITRRNFTKYHTPLCESCEWYHALDHKGRKVEVCGVGTNFIYITRTKTMKICKALGRPKSKKFPPSAKHIDNLVREGKLKFYEE